jgi:hypothetical protein
LIYEVQSNGSAGKLDGFHTIWFDRTTKLYYFFACFNDPDHPCRMRGTAHWEGDAFVNDYESSQAKRPGGRIFSPSLPPRTFSLQPWTQATAR